MSTIDRPVTPFRAVARIVGLWRHQFWRLTLGMALSVASLLFGVALLALAGGTTVTGPHAPLWIAPVFTGGAALLAAGGLRALGVGRVVLRYAERLATHDAMFRALADLRVWFFRQVAGRSAGGIGFRRSGDLLSRLVADIEALDAIYLRINVPLVGALVLLPVLLVVLGWRDLPLAVVVTLLFALAAFGLPALTLATTRAAGRRLAERGAALRVAVLDAVSGLHEIRAFGAEDRMLAAAQGRESALIGAQLDLARRATLADTLGFLLGQGALLAVLAAIANGLGHGPIVTVVFAAIALFLTLASFEVATGLPRAGVLFGHAAAAAQRVVEAAGPPLADDVPGGVSVPVGHRLRLEGVAFGWTPDRPVLEGLTLDVPEGARIAILGPSGAGKSTIASLALGVARPWAGQVTLGGVSLERIAPAELRRRVAVLSQATHLFADTIRANLLLARRDADEAAIWAALETAAIAGWVRALPDGLDTWLGEGGALVSGGQARRIALARTLLSEAAVLILDEPASGLDAETERAFLATLNEATPGRTVVLIAHRLTGVERLDRIWRLAGGHLAAAAA